MRIEARDAPELFCEHVSLTGVEFRGEGSQCGVGKSGARKEWGFGGDQFGEGLALTTPWHT